ncbi:hypothetical protein IAD21_02100 [Abditibacteriota bacterium]|nr:hypothetical protein IAD21_02100 [Abditibacteriota bacterium]
MKVAFDTNIIISRRVRIFPRSHYLSAIVLAEIISGAQNRSDLKLWNAIQDFAERSDRFLVPSAEDWLQAGLALQRLSQQSKRENFGSTPKFSPEERQRMFNDCLLAVSCRRAGVVVVTDNLKDFERISAVCRVKWLSGDEFFAPSHP